MNICLHAKFQVRWCYGFGSTALQEKKEKKKTKNMKNKFHCISGVLCRNTFIFGEFIIFCMF